MIAMVRAGVRIKVWLPGLLLCACALAAAQKPQPAPAQLNESGQIATDGHSTPYAIRRLPLSSFPDLPEAVVALLSQRACLVPQTYQAHRPENVIHASFERPGSSDWAVLCSAQGNVTLLVFFSSAPARLWTLASAPETARLQSHDVSGVLGFDWGIDAASPERIREARSGMEHRPPILSHDALADTQIDHRTVYHFYWKSEWTVLEMPDE
jgi:hypothetical protein